MKPAVHTEARSLVAPAAGTAEADPLSLEERARVASATRLKFTMMVFVVTLIVALSAMMFVGVTRIFDWLTPSIRHDLEHKAARGALELAQTAQLGMVVGDQRAVRASVVDYADDEDVVGLRVLDATGHDLYQKGDFSERLQAVLAGSPGKTRDLGEVYAAWAPSEIEGAKVGSVVVFISKARLQAGLSLRRDILIAAAIGCLLALGACLVFVSLYIGPILRVTAEAFVRLEKTTEAALAASRLKSQFLANMSHEIRTPMNGILGVLDLINRTSPTAKQQRYIQTIETSARGLLTIINDVLDFSKLEAGKYDLRYDDFEPSQLLQEVAELLAPKAYAKQVELVTRIDADVPDFVRGDIDRVKQVLLNLLGNAVKFTEKGHIEMRLSLESTVSDGHMLRFAVKDTGLGIRPEDQSQLFGVFSQVDGSLTRKYGGTGLGLAICKRLAAAMGGSVGVESALGEGSTFWFTIHAALADTERKCLLPPREAAVLLVTRHKAQREALSELIQRWGMDCEATDSPERACESVVSRAGGFTAAVIDGSLDSTTAPDSTLFDLCTAEGLPVIRLLSTTQVANEGSHPALQSYLCKPVRASELYNGLVALLEGGVFTSRRRSEREPGSEAKQVGLGRVLVVDDNEINRLVAVELLSELGYDADTACDGIEAVERAKQGGYDAILMDCQMPVLDGYGATQQIRQLPEPLSRVPIIALTAHAMADDRDRVLRAGMDDYTSKPIRARVLERVLQRWIGELKRDATQSMPAPPTSEPTQGIERFERFSPPSAAARAMAGSKRPAPGASSGADLDPNLPRSPRAIALFLKTAPELLPQLTRAVGVGDPVQIKTLAHKLKGSCLSLGATRMAAACHAVEVAALDGRIDQEAHATLPEHLAVVTPLLSALLHGKTSNDTK